jgi:hypothetical protein
MGPKKIFRSGLVFALIGVACSAQVEPGTVGTPLASSCDGFDAGQLREAAQPCSQIGKRCAFDANDQPAPVDPEAALKCECLDPYPLTWHCGPRVWP